MIKVITAVDTAHDIFMMHQREKNVVFCPSGVYAGPFTIETYLADARIGFCIEKLIPVLNRLGIEDLHAPMLELNQETQWLVHLLANLSIDVETIYIELPDTDFDLQTKMLIADLIHFYESSKQQIIVFSRDEQLTKLLTMGNSFIYTEKAPTFKLGATQVSVIVALFKQRYSIFFSSIFIIFSIFSLSAVDNHLTRHQKVESNVPSNIVVLDNELTTCEFNTVAYGISDDNCEHSTFYTYEDINRIVEMDDVETVYFDDADRIDNLQTAILSPDQTTTVSVPNIANQLSSFFGQIPCIDGQDTIANVVCGEYDPNTSLVAAVTEQNHEAIVRNIANNQTENPRVIAIKTTNSASVAKQLATEVPDISVITHQALQKVDKHEHINFYIKAFIDVTIISIVFAFAIYFSMVTRKVVYSDARYHYKFLAMDRSGTFRCYYIAQLLLYGGITSIIMIISAKLMLHNFTLLLGLYTCVLNAAIWTFLNEKNGHLIVK